MSALSASLGQVSARINDFWQGLAERDRRALSLLLLIGLPVLLIWGLLLPAKTARQEAQTARDEAVALRAWIRQEGPNLQGMGGGARISPAELPQRVQALATAQALSVERLESDPSGVRLALGNTRMGTLAGFLQLCRAQGIRVLEAQIIRGSGEGSQVRLRLGV